MTEGSTEKSPAPQSKAKLFPECDASVTMGAWERSPRVVETSATPLSEAFLTAVRLHGSKIPGDNERFEFRNIVATSYVCQMAGPHKMRAPLFSRKYLFGSAVIGIEDALLEFNGIISRIYTAIKTTPRDPAEHAPSDLDWQLTRLQQEQKKLQEIQETTPNAFLYIPATPHTSPEKIQKDAADWLWTGPVEPGVSIVHPASSQVLLRVTKNGTPVLHIPDGASPSPLYPWPSKRPHVVYARLPRMVR